MKKELSNIDNFTVDTNTDNDNFIRDLDTGKRYLTGDNDAIIRFLFLRLNKD